MVNKLNLTIGTRIRSCDATAFDGLDNRALFKGFTRLNPSMNELFFAKRVLLVEGPEDAVAVSATLKTLGRISTRPEELEWSVIVCGGKQSMPFFQRVLNAFAIPYAVLHDTDITPNMTPDIKANQEKTNAAIRSLAYGNKVHTYPVKLEHSLGLETHFSDQYAAHVFFSDPSNITQEVKDIIGSVFP